MTPEIIRIEPGADLRNFYQFPHDLYRNCPQYVPLLNGEMLKFLRPSSNPFFRNAEAAFFLARRQGRTVGRIAAIVNRRHLEIYDDHTGFFGFFDAENDPEVARALLAAASGYLRSHGLTRMVGPENFNTNDSVGILTAGFDDSPVVMMPYNYAYYRTLLEGQGLRPLIALSAYPLETARVLQRIGPTADLYTSRLARQGITLRSIDLRHFERETRQLREVYNAANANNWGFVPLTEAEFRHTAADMRQIIESGNVQLAEKDGRLIGFLVSLPDVNQVFRRIPDGRLFPFGWMHLIGFRKKISRLRVLILGVLPEYRGRGIDWCLYARITRFAADRGFPQAEAGYVLENNLPMRRMLQRLGAEPAKAYLLYETSTAKTP